MAKNKLDKAQTKSLEEHKDKLEKLFSKVEEAVQIYNEEQKNHWDKLNGTLEEYNAAVIEAQDFAAEIA
ncbi:MAG: hypothetical protein A2139_06935 [Desulfobacca sp. RBG_16_60_12]|nr:MAG: hypothetical protein A2139_06935 [Desulfobacca sp. RBG_16_60_12]OHD23823.1 MAG: hypothetical protein A2Y38_17185 [Spirochaetes bacterium GWB1_59_5]